MAIKRYQATADTTITNAFQVDLTTRGTGSNMGRSDILEAFSIYGQAGGNSTAAELSRVVVNFPLATMATDRTNGTLPASGSVRFYLRLFDAEHRQTTPQSYALSVNALSGSWQEGYGLDMENYTDLTYDKVGANWKNAGGEHAVGSFTMALQGGANKAAMSGQTFVLTDTYGTSQTFTFNITDNIVANGTIGMNSDSNTTDIINTIKSAINDASLSNLLITATTITAVGDSDSEMRLLINQDVTGAAGNYNVNLEGVAHLSVLNSGWGFTGGSGRWATEGGQYFLDTSSSFEQEFDSGLEDLEVDITELVEQWINSGGNVLGSKDRDGLIIKLAPTYEAQSSFNSSGSLTTYYTKKFFSRSSEHFFKRPIVEARWDSATRDNRGNFYLSSSLSTPTDNLNTLYMYNYVRGNLRDIGNRSSNLPALRLYHSSGSVPEMGTDDETGRRGFLNSLNVAVEHMTASRVSTGVYKATFAVTAGVVSDTYPYLVDVWTLGAAGTQIHTGSAFLPKTHNFSVHNPSKNYVVSMPNLKQQYNKRQIERFRLFVREKNWSPSIYSKAVASPETILIHSASYQLTRVADDQIVINYGTSSTSHTMLSYDVSGNYFDLDMKMLEPGYTYGLKLSFYEDSVGSYIEQPHTFTFRVVEDEY